MKRIIVTFSMGFVLFTVRAQQKEGRVVYERTIQIQMKLQGMGDGMEHLLPKSRTDKFEVLFTNDQSLKRAVQDELPDDNTGEGGGVQIRMIGAGANDVSYVNLSNGLVVEQREFATKNYILTDSIHRLNWKLTGETMTILNYPCQQAVAQHIGKRTMMSMDNGQMKQEVVPDTSNITVWFTPSIPVPAGPEYQGQLPGLVLAIDVNNGKTVYKAIEVSAKVEVSEIKVPTKGKKVTQEEFAKERDKVMQEMQRNSGGRGMMIKAG